MDYQKVINLSDNIPNQPSKFRTKNWVEINDVSRGTNNINSQFKFKTSILKSSLCDYSDAHINITIPNIGTAAAPNNRKKIYYLKIFVIVMSVYNFLNYSDIYSKITGI